MNSDPPHTLVHEQEMFTANDNFPITPEKHGRTVEGPGNIDGILIIADENSIGIRVETDETTLIDESHDKLKEWNDELAHISAYNTSNDERVIVVEDFAFRGYARAEVKVADKTQFDWVRAVYTLGVR